MNVLALYGVNGSVGLPNEGDGAALIDPVEPIVVTRIFEERV